MHASRSKTLNKTQIAIRLSMTVVLSLFGVCQINEMKDYNKIYFPILI
jgi:hypothetical protein